MNKRIFSLLLAALLLSSAVSCSTATSEETTPQAAAETMETAGTGETVEEETVIPLEIPEEDNNGRDFHVLVPTEKAYEFATELIGEVVNDAVFERTAKAEEHFNIKFSYQFESGNWDTRDSYNKFISKAVASGDSTYDLTTGYIVCTLPLFMGGNFMNLAELNQLNLDNPWWMRDQMENLAITDHLFCCMGDANLSVYKDCSVVYFNKVVLENLQLEDPYTLVRENEWVMEKFLEMSEAAVSDANGDGKISHENDSIGTYLQGVPLRALQTGMDVTFIIPDEADVLTVTPLTDRIVKASEYAEIFENRKDIYAELNAVDFYTFPDIFANDRALFHMSYLYALEGAVMRNMESDFGVVPYPKLDESQEKFKTQIGTSSNVNFIPITCSDSGLTCRVLETLSYHSMLDVIPAYYNVALENKYTRDADVPEMLALIRDSMTMNFDFAFSTSPNLGGTNTVFMNANGNIASHLAAKTKQWKAAIKVIVRNID